MWDVVITFFSQPPPALDPVFIPWLAALIAGNVIIVSGTWALLKYIAKLTPWAEDDRILQIISGAYGAVKGAVSPIKAVDHVCDDPATCDEHVVDGNGTCEKCGQDIE
jgi:hypothetical protein